MATTMYGSTPPDTDTVTLAAERQTMLREVSRMSRNHAHTVEHQVRQFLSRRTWS